MVVTLPGMSSSSSAKVLSSRLCWSRAARRRRPEVPLVTSLAERGGAGRGAVERLTGAAGAGGPLSRLSSAAVDGRRGTCLFMGLLCRDTSGRNYRSAACRRRGSSRGPGNAGPSLVGLCPKLMEWGEADKFVVAADATRRAGVGGPWAVASCRARGSNGPAGGDEESARRRVHGGRRRRRRRRPSLFGRAVLSTAVVLLQELLEGLSQATPTLDEQSMFSSSTGSLSPAASDLEQEEEAPPEEVAPAPPTPQPASEEELERSTDDDRSGDLLQLMVPVATERLMSAQTPSTELTDDELEEEELVAGWGADVLQLPSSLELDIKVQKGPDTLGVSVDSVDKGVNGMLVVAVVSGGAIAKDGRIVPGDYLLSLNNESLRKVTNSQARAILRRAQLLSTDISVTYIPGEAATAYRKSLLESEPPIVPLTKAIKISPSSPYIQKESEVPEILRGDKLVLRESELDSNLVSETATSSAADTGVTESDSITAVSPLQVPVRTIVKGDEQVLLKLGSEPISEVIVTSEPDSVSWRRDSRDDTVSRKDDPSVTSIPPSRSQGSLSDLSSPTMTVTQPPQGHTPSTPMSSSVLLAKHWGPERMVEILREPNCSLGISIVGGKVDLYNAGPDSGSAISGIFIKNVLPHSPAGRTGELKTGDRILEVDGIDLRQASHERAVEVIRGAGNPVCFLVQSLIQWSVDGDVESQSTEVASTSSAGAAGGSERRRASTSPTPSSELLKVTPQPVPQARTPTPELIQAGMADEMVQEIPKQVSQRKPSIIKPKEPQSKQDKQEDRDIEKKKPIYSSSEESEDEEDVRELEGNMYTKKGHEINRASAGNVKRTKEEIEADPEEEDDYGYTKNKVKKKYGGLGHPVLLVQMERGAQGLGLSLAGHKDRNRMAVFVVGLNPAGAAFKTGAIHVGDEILEVNGVVLQGRCHLNASAIIKGLPGPIFKVILLRRDTALQDLAVKPITQFPVTLDDETPEERYSNFRGLRTVTIKKGSQGLGIMIIEGKHAEVGQGIFISDIQEGSAAEQAGLIVGDMILAVNKDTLLGADYDSAASLLKKTEGVVTLVVCNPNKAKEEEKKGDADGKGANAQSPSPGVAQSSAPSKEPEKPRLLPKPFITSLKPQKTSPSKSNIVSPSLPPNAGSPMMETLSPGMGTSKSPGTPGTTRSPSAASTPALVSPSISPSSTLRLSPTPSGKRATTPEEPPVDPVTCEITAGKETTIEINKDKMGLGLSIVGGSDTLLSVIIIHEVYPDGAAAKDGRLKPGDQILEVNSEDFRNITHSKALAALRQTPAKVKMVVYRDEASAKEEDIFDIMEVELTKKPGKGLGLSIVGRRNGHGVFISDVVHGGTAEACGKLMKGDQILAVNGQDLKSATQEEAAAVLKTATGKVSMKLGRLKAGSRRSSSGNTDRVSNVTRGAVLSDSWPCCVEQNFPRFSTKRSSLVRQFANWSFRRRNL